MTANSEKVRYDGIKILICENVGKHKTVTSIDLSEVFVHKMSMSMWFN